MKGQNLLLIIDTLGSISSSVQRSLFLLMNICVRHLLKTVGYASVPPFFNITAWNVLFYCDVAFRVGLFQLNLIFWAALSSNSLPSGCAIECKYDSINCGVGRMTTWFVFVLVLLLCTVSPTDMPKATEAAEHFPQHWGSLSRTHDKDHILVYSHQVTWKE